MRLSNANTDLISVITAQNGAKVVASFADATISGATVTAFADQPPQATSITSATTTTVVATPGANLVRRLDTLNIKNTYAGSHTITVQLSSSATLYVLVTAILLENESISYERGAGWCALDVNGNRKEVIGQMAFVSPTRQVLTSGSAATYTTGIVGGVTARRIVIRMWGAGGGGSGSGSTGPNNGGAGGDTIFNSIHVAGGGGGGNTVAGAGGTGGTGSASVRIAGYNGFVAYPEFASATQVALAGGTGGGAGGGLGGTGAANGTNGAANTGGGGGGGGLTAVTFAVAAADYISAGGGSGEYAELLITAPSATYTYTIGAGGTAGSAGTGGQAAGAGGTGLIIVDEYYY